MIKDKFLLRTMLLPDVWERYGIQYEECTPDIGIQPYKISICTNCMNRTSDLMQTYEQNIIDNPQADFVLLNYNSQDNMDEWVATALQTYIDAGVLNYYKTTEPKYYSMAHSRNITFKLAQGDIINSVDGDHFTNKGFAQKINEIANAYNDKLTVLVKSKQKNRGRIGMFKETFISLGGYNEDLEGYGFEDEDLLLRAYHTGCRVIRYGGAYMRITDDHSRHPTENYKNKDWQFTQRRNILLSLLGITMKQYVANTNRHWGKATLLKNFRERIKI